MILFWNNSLETVKASKVQLFLFRILNMVWLCPCIKVPINYDLGQPLV